MERMPDASRQKDVEIWNLLPSTSIMAWVYVEQRSVSTICSYVHAFLNFFFFMNMYMHLIHMGDLIESAISSCGFLVQGCSKPKPKPKCKTSFCSIFIWSQMFATYTYMPLPPNPNLAQGSGLFGLLNGWLLVSI